MRQTFNSQTGHETSEKALFKLNSLVHEESKDSDAISKALVQYHNSEPRKDIANNVVSHAIAKIAKTSPDFAVRIVTHALENAHPPSSPLAYVLIPPAFAAAPETYPIFLAFLCSKIRQISPVYDQNFTDFTATMWQDFMAKLPAETQIKACEGFLYIIAKSNKSPISSDRLGASKDPETAVDYVDLMAGKRNEVFLNHFGAYTILDCVDKIKSAPKRVEYLTPLLHHSLDDLVREKAAAKIIHIAESAKPEEVFAILASAAPACKYSRTLETVMESAWVKTQDQPRSACLEAAHAIITKSGLNRNSALYRAAAERVLDIMPHAVKEQDFSNQNREILEAIEKASIFYTSRALTLLEQFPPATLAQQARMTAEDFLNAGPAAHV